MHPLICRALGAVPTDPTLLGRTRKRRWQEGATHSSTRLVSAESELGTLPVSALFSRYLHTRSGLGRSAVLRRTHSNDVPLRYRRTVPKQEWGDAQYSKIGERGERARHTLRQRVVAELAAHPKRTRPLGRCYAAPTPTMYPYGPRAPYPTGGVAP